MKELFLKVLTWTLKRLAQLTIWRYRPGIIGVTGSVGKTSTKTAIAAVLSRERRVRWSKGNLNNELGLPLTVLGEWTAEELRLVSRSQPAGEKKLAKFVFWLKVVILSSWRLIFGRRFEYPEMLILEYGADRPGDIRKLINIARPDIGVLTAVGEVPVHVEFYAGPREVAREKAQLLECLPAASFAILNRDDPRVMEMSVRTRAHLITFGFHPDAEVRIFGLRNLSQKYRPLGITFKLEYGGSSVPVVIRGAVGKAQAYAAAAAAAVGIAFGMNLVKIAEVLREYIPPPHRMEIVAAVKGAYLIDDCYNSSPAAAGVALSTLKNLPAKRRIAVLGDMLEIGKYAMEEHEKLGKLVSPFVDFLFTIGPRAKFIADGARAAGMNQRKIQSFNLAEEARLPLQNLLREGDLVLIKGSRAMELDKIVEEVRAF